VDNLLALARKQFDFYSEDLARGNPFSEKNDAAAIDRARLHSRSSPASSRSISSCSQTPAAREEDQLQRAVPGSAEVVANNRDVLGAFTKPGWAPCRRTCAKPTGSSAASAGAGRLRRAKPDARNSRRHSKTLHRDYIARWREFLRDTVVVRYSNLKDAARS